MSNDWQYVWLVLFLSLDGIFIWHYYRKGFRDGVNKERLENMKREHERSVQKMLMEKSFTDILTKRK